MSLTDVAYARLREDILLGRLRPNELLVEVDLAERLQVSRTPVRESLQRLARDGLVVSRRRRWMVSDRTLDDIREMFEVRAALEGHVARLATTRAEDEALARIAAFARQRPLLDCRDNREMAERNDAFHHLIVEAAGDGQLAVMLEQNRAITLNREVLSNYSRPDVETSQRQHEALAQALRARDPDRAADLAREHVFHAFDVVRSRSSS